MKRLMLLMILGMLFGSATGCRIGECWRYAWNSRFPPRQVVVAEPCVVCDPCCDPCATSCSTPCCAPSMVVPGGTGR